MKRIIFALSAALFAGSLCFAEEAATTATSGTTAAAADNAAAVPAATTTATPAAATAAAANTNFIGRVYLTSSRNTLKGKTSQMTAKDEKGLDTTFKITDDTTIVDKDGKTTSLSWLSRDDKVSVDYSEDKDGSKIAKSIKVLPNW